MKKEGSREGRGAFVERLLYARTAVSGPHHLAIHFSRAAWEVNATAPVFRDWPVIAGGGAGVGFCLGPEPKGFLDFLQLAHCPVLLGLLGV